MAGKPSRTKFVAFKSSALGPGEMRKLVLPDGRAIAIYNVEGQFYATDDLCTHGGASLTEEGVLSGRIIECSWHFGSFNVTTGEVVTTPCSRDLRTYPISEAGGMLYIEA
ncbi:non-heme iron oxygenase ferredoxin subunit [Acidocella sp.]|uniref:non-heme iron oxygenase ferredoxin subunit n=1 Tax=Acidocella sp. TaxID=50710 RepID=UPI00260EE603|nr:non-heme iron oxygenase ferredoxin subunit [Acidocella sp.]MDD2795736.1 non-heme iron oxygenase ferredoxin subunit [Acidocella sp.]